MDYPASSLPGALFLRFATAKLEQLSQRILLATDRLPDEAFWALPNESSNSVAQLLLHLSGNIRQWILHGVDGQPDLRDRDAEFAATPSASLTRAEVRETFSTTVTSVLSSLSQLDPTRLTRQINPQGYQLSVLEAVFHVTEHFSYHAGQIFLLVKFHSNKSLDFYSHLENSNKTHTETIP